MEGKDIKRRGEGGEGPYLWLCSLSSSCYDFFFYFINQWSIIALNSTGCNLLLLGADIISLN